MGSAAVAQAARAAAGTAAGLPAEEAGRSRRVGVVIQHSPISHLNSAMMNGVLAFIRRSRAWRTRLFDPDVRRLELAQWKPDGLIVALDLPLDGFAVDGRPVPVVYANGQPGPYSDYSVAQNESHIGGLAAGYFLERGYRRFAYVGVPGRAFSNAREAAFAGHLRRHGHDCDVVHVRDTGREGHYTSPRRLARLARPLAVFAANDGVAMGVLEVARRVGRNVPQDWAVLGVDDIVLQCEFSDPPLSSIVHPQVRAGQVAAALLDDLMRGKKPADPHPRIASPGVHTRRSTETTAVEDALVSDAIRWMIRRINQPLTVTKAASDLNVSRNTLHRRFVATLGHGMKQEHRRQQILRAQELLQRTGESLMDIAVMCGFNDGAHFSRSFRSATGRTPARYRRSTAFVEPPPGS